MPLYRYLIPLNLAVMSGCAGIPTDRGFGDANSLIQSRGGPAVEAPQQTAEKIERLTDQWLSRPLTADDTVRIALLNNPVRRVEYARLGIAQAELYDAARLDNPTLGATVLDSNENGAANQVTLGLAQNLSNLLLYNARKRFAQGEAERIKYAAAAELQSFSSEVKAAYYAHLGAMQVAQMRQIIADAADISARLAQRFYVAGNINRLELNRELAAGTQARIEATRAAAEADAARTQLNTLMGLKANRHWVTSNRIALPVAEEDSLPTLLKLAHEHRLDVAATRLEVALLEDVLGVSRSFRLLGEVEVGVEYERETDRSRLFGPTLSLELPIFNQGGGRIMRAQAMLEDSQARLQALEIEADNAVALAHKRVGASRDVIEHYRQRLIPEREEIVQRTQELQNYMIVGQFELLLAKQEEYDAYQGYLEALRDYWLARVELAAAIGSTLPSAMQIDDASIDVESLIQPSAADHPNAGHGMKGMNHAMPPPTGSPPATTPHSGHKHSQEETP